MPNAQRTSRAIVASLQANDTRAAADQGKVDLARAPRAAGRVLGRSGASARLRVDPTRAPRRRGRPTDPPRDSGRRRLTCRAVRERGTVIHVPARTIRVTLSRTGSVFSWERVRLAASCSHPEGHVQALFSHSMPSGHGTSAQDGEQTKNCSPMCMT